MSRRAFVPQNEDANTWSVKEHEAISPGRSLRILKKADHQNRLRQSPFPRLVQEAIRFLNRQVFVRLNGEGKTRSDVEVIRRRTRARMVA